MGYSCNRSMPFKNHSTFYHFTLSGVKAIPISPNPEQLIQFTNVINSFETSVRLINLDRPCFICPGGHYGQKIAYYLQPFRKYIRGFLDNDPSKQGLRMYGTTVYVYSPYVLQEHKDKNISIILYGGVYTHELKSQLNQIHSKITYIEI